MDTRFEKPLVFLPKTENQMLKNGKTANRNKTHLKNDQNRETENPNAPIIPDEPHVFGLSLTNIKDVYESI